MAPPGHYKNRHRAGSARRRPMNQTATMPAVGPPSGLAYRKFRDRVVEFFLLARRAGRGVHDARHRRGAGARIAAVLRARVAPGLPDRHDVDAAVRRSALRHPAARRGHAGDDAGRARGRDPGGHDHRHLPERVRAVSPARGDQAGPRAARRGADRGLRLLRADDGHALPAEAHSRTAGLQHAFRGPRDRHHDHSRTSPR